MGKTAWEEADEIAKEAAEKSNSLLGFAKITTSPKAFRFLTPQGADSLAIYGEHFVDFPAKKRAFSCPKYNGGDECIICDSPKGPGKGILRQGYGKKFLSYVIDREDENKIKILRFGPMLWADLRAFVQSVDELSAKDFTIMSIKDSNNFTKYIVEPTKKETALNSEEQNEVAKLKPIRDMVPVYDEEIIAGLMSEEPTSNGAGGGTATNDAAAQLRQLLNSKKDSSPAPTSSNALTDLLKKRQAPEAATAATTADASDATTNEDEDDAFFKSLARNKKPK